MINEDFKQLTAYARYDGIYYPAEAQITSPNTILVRSSSVTRPRFVRYGWQPFTRANLVNEVGLPCSTFQWTIRK